MPHCAWLPGAILRYRVLGVSKKTPDERLARFTSPACLAHEFAPDGRALADPGQARDVARWRRVERERLIAAREALPAQHREHRSKLIASQLDTLLPAGEATIVSVYWPIRGEPDLRPWMQQLSLAGVRVALPVVVAHGEPLIFREWQPGARLVRGVSSIPYPADGPSVVPTVTIAPLVGFDPACFRLGYGGGFFDRTLVALAPRPLAIGVGDPVSALSTIFPQPHDIPMDWIVTGASEPIRRNL